MHVCVAQNPDEKNTGSFMYREDYYRDRSSHDPWLFFFLSTEASLTSSMYWSIMMLGDVTEPIYLQLSCV